MLLSLFSYMVTFILGGVCYGIFFGNNNTTNSGTIYDYPEDID